MFGRENLEIMQLDGWEAYDIKDVNPVMDKMEARIKELEDELHHLKAWEYYEAPDTGWI